MNPTEPRLVLASTSPYRRALLARLVADFEAVGPRVDESMRAGETPRELAVRLAREKAEAVAERRPGCIVIAGDQVPALGSQVLRKPGDHERAMAQLRACSGREVVFYTATCVIGPAPNQTETWVDETTIRFRNLADDEIERYLQRDQPYDCAGSFKSEALGISLFASLRTDDATALQGLPLIRLSAELRALGVKLP